MSKPLKKQRLKQERLSHARKMIDVLHEAKLLTDGELLTFDEILLKEWSKNNLKVSIAKLLSQDGPLRDPKKDTIEREKYREDVEELKKYYQKILQAFEDLHPDGEKHKIQMRKLKKGKNAMLYFKKNNKSPMLTPFQIQVEENYIREHAPKAQQAAEMQALKEGNFEFASPEDEFENPPAGDGFKNPPAGDEFEKSSFCNSNNKVCFEETFAEETMEKDSLNKPPKKKRKLTQREKNIVEDGKRTIAMCQDDTQFKMMLNKIFAANEKMQEMFEEQREADQKSKEDEQKRIKEQRNTDQKQHEQTMNEIRNGFTSICESLRQRRQENHFDSFQFSPTQQASQSSSHQGFQDQQRHLTMHHQDRASTFMQNQRQQFPEQRGNHCNTQSFY